jgi:hypothetical protein
MYIGQDNARQGNHSVKLLYVGDKATHDIHIN